MDERPANNPRHTFGRKTKRAAIQLKQFPIPIPEIFAIFVFGFLPKTALPISGTSPAKLVGKITANCRKVVRKITMGI